MAEELLKKIEEADKRTKKLESDFKKLKSSGEDSFGSVSKKVKKTKSDIDSLNKSFERFLEIAEGTSAVDFATTASEIPNYTRGVTKMTASHRKYNREASITKEMLNSLGVSYNKTMVELEKKSGRVQKAMSGLLDNANQAAAFRDSLATLPKVLKQIQDAMGKTPEFKIGSVVKLTDMVDNLEGAISDVDFKYLKGQIEKISKGDDFSTLSRNIKDKLENINIEPNIDGKDSVKKLVKDIGNELGKSRGLSQGDVLLGGLYKEIKELRKNTEFSDLMEKNKDEIDSLVEAMKAPGVTYESITDRILSLNNKLGGSFDSFFNNYMSGASELEKEQDTLTRKQEEFSDKMRKGYSFAHFTDESVAQFESSLAQMSAFAYDIQARNIIPDDQLLNSREMLESLRMIRSLNAENNVLENELLNSEGKTKEEIAEILDKQTKTTDQIKSQVRYMHELEKSSQEYATNVLAGADSGFDDGNAKRLSGEFYKMSGYLGKLGGELNPEGTMSKGLTKLGGLAGRFGSALKSIAFPIGLITGAFSLTKMLINLESEVKAMNKQFNKTGLLVGVSADNMSSAIGDFNSKANNFAGNLSAAAGGDDLAMGREQIVGIVDALNEAGIPSRNLAKQMKGVSGTAAEAKNELLGASTMVTVFSTNLGVETGVVTGMIGEWAQAYGTSMGKVKDTFTDITNAATSSNMSTNRFLATVQTATAGMSLYEDQVADVAKILSSLSRTTGMSESGLIKYGKAMSSMANDTNAAAKGLAIMRSQDPKAFEKLSDAATKSLVKIEEDLKKAKASGDMSAINQLEGKKKQTNQFKENIGRGDVFNAGANLKFLSEDLVDAITLSQVKFIEEKGGTGQGVKESVAESIGPELKTLYVEMTRLGLNSKKIEDIKAGKGDRGDIKKYEELKKITVANNKATENPREKIVEATQNTFKALIGGVIPLLTMISAAVMAGGGLKAMSDIFKNFKNGAANKGGWSGGLKNVMGGGGIEIPTTGGINSGGKPTGSKQTGSKTSDVGQKIGGGAVAGAGAISAGAAVATAAVAAAVWLFINGITSTAIDIFTNGYESVSKDLKQKYNERTFWEKVFSPIDSIFALIDNFQDNAAEFAANQIVKKAHSNERNLKVKSLLDTNNIPEGNYPDLDKKLIEYDKYNPYNGTNTSPKNMEPLKASIENGVDLSKTSSGVKGISTRSPAVANTTTDNSKTQLTYNITINDARDPNKFEKIIDHNNRKKGIQIA